MWNWLSKLKPPPVSVWRVSGHDLELSAPPLLGAAQTKARLLIKFLENEQKLNQPFISPAIYADYNRLRELVLSVDPKLEVVIPPGIPSSADERGMVRHADLIFFCQQILRLIT